MKVIQKRDKIIAWYQVLQNLNKSNDLYIKYISEKRILKNENIMLVLIEGIETM